MAGNGPSFSVGRDLNDRSSATATAMPRARQASEFELLERGAWGTRLLYEFPVPIVCALKGWCWARCSSGRCWCDIRVAGESAKMALPGVDHGVIPDSAGLAKLFEIGGAGLALDLALTGRRIDADEALRLGLVSQVVADDDLDEVVLDLARSIAERSPLVVRLLREHVQALAAGNVRATLGREVVGQAMVLRLTTTASTAWPRPRTASPATSGAEPRVPSSSGEGRYGAPHGVRAGTQRRPPARDGEGRRGPPGRAACGRRRHRGITVLFIAQNNEKVETTFVFVERRDPPVGEPAGGGAARRPARPAGRGAVGPPDGRRREAGRLTGHRLA